MDNCIFCKIVRRELPAEVVYEDDHFVAFLDIHPQSPGHLQVIPKTHYRWVWDVPVDNQKAPNIAGYFTVVGRIAKALQGTFGTDAVFSRVMGDEVPHAHVWLFPHPGEAKGDKNDFVGNAAKIREMLK